MKPRHGGIFSRIESKKRYIFKHKGKGLCVDCVQKVEEGHIRCKKHLEYQKKANEKFRKYENSKRRI